MRYSSLRSAHIFYIADAFEMLLFGVFGYPYRNVLVIGCLFLAMGVRAKVYILITLGLAASLIGLQVSTIDISAFNFFLSIASLSVIVSIAKFPRSGSDGDLLALPPLQLLRALLWISLSASLLQGFSHEFWKGLVPNATFLPFRGPAFQSEPSYLNTLVLIFYLNSILSAGGARRTSDAFIFPIAVFATASLSVVLVGPVYFVYLWKGERGRYFVIPILLLGFAFLELIFGDRLDAASTSDSFVYSVTLGVTSWRNIPDFGLIQNIPDFLFPRLDHVSGIQEAISQYWFAQWIEFNFSLFSTWVLSFGAIATIPICLLLLISASRDRSGSIVPVIMIYVVFYCLFFVAKFDPLAWIALGLAARPNNIRPAIRSSKRNLDVGDNLAS